MSIFGQVWLWSAAAFVVGVLLTWLFLARPAQARSRHLERRLLAAQSAPAAQPTRTLERDPDPVSAPVAKKEPVGETAPEPAGEHHAPPSWLERDSLAGRSYQPGSEIDDDSLFEPEPEPEHRETGARETPAEATTVFDAFGRDLGEPAGAERGSLFEEPERGAGYDSGQAGERGAEAGRTSLFDAGSGYDGQAGEQARPGSLFEREPSGGAHAAADESGQASGFGSVLDGGQDAGAGFERGQAAEAGFDREQVAGSGLEDGQAAGFEAEHAQPGAGERAGRGSLFEPEVPERGSLFDPDHVPEAQRPQQGGSFAPFAAPEPEPPAYAFGADEQQPPADEEAGTETTQVLPRRQPRRSAHAFDPPRPVQPSMRTVERREPVQPEEGGRSGSLFEPTPRASNAPTPPPARAHGEAAVPPGPFGPGSAMPRPGGGRPSEEFAVKASVTALRYCTEDSPQFARMVAEVWFRTAEDAERVGFRPL